MRRTVAPPEGVAEAPPAGARSRNEYLAAVLGAALTFAALALLILVRYPLRHYSYPIGWDAAYYVWRSAAVTVDGLARIGTVRAGSPLLVGILMRITGQNGFTMVPVAMAVLAGIVALGAAAMARAALEVSTGWMLVIGVLSWLAFGHIGMIGGHLDNVLNAAFVLPAFAAAVAFAGQRRGATAVAVLLAASALAEWPFYVLAVAIFLLGLAVFAWPSLRSPDEHRPELLAAVRPLLLAVGASGVFAGLTFISRPPGRLLHYFDERGRTIIRGRFLQRLRDPSRYYALPLAAVGGFLAARTSLSARRDPARRLFLSLMAAWIVVSLVASIAQLLDVPVAGARLLNYLFAVPVLTGVFFWAMYRVMASSDRTRRIVFGGLVPLAALVAFGALAWQGEAGRKPWIPPASASQAAAADLYATQSAPNTSVIFLQREGGHPWAVLQASVSPDTVPRVERFAGTPAQFEQAMLAENASGTASDTGSSEPIAFVLRAYNRSGYREAVGMADWATVVPGVLVRTASVPRAFVNGPTPIGNLGAFPLAWISAAVVLLLAATGSGWAMALLPADPAIRVALCPALGAAALTLAAVVWDRVGLGFSTPEAWVLALIVTGAGWTSAGWTRRRRRGAPAPPALAGKRASL